MCSNHREKCGWWSNYLWLRAVPEWLWSDWYYDCCQLWPVCMLYAVLLFTCISGRPAGACGQRGQIVPGQIHPHHTTQEEDIVSCWLTAQGGRTRADQNRHLFALVWVWVGCHVCHVSSCFMQVVSLHCTVISIGSIVKQSIRNGV